MIVNDHLQRFGLRITEQALAEIRGLMCDQTRAEGINQGDGDTELMRLLCVQLFIAGHPEAVLLIWSAKMASMDADCGIEVQLLCGAGLAATKVLLAESKDPAATKALQRVITTEKSGDFKDFDPGEWTRACERYYAG